MCNKRFMSVVFLAIVGVVVLVFSSGQAASPSSNPEGTFILTVTIEGMPVFKEIFTLHKGGTISETNTLLHPNSANELFPFNGSDGYGAWKRGLAGTVNLKFVKMVFDADTNEHISYLVVDATALIVGDTFITLESDVNILLGPDFFNPLGIVPFGAADAVGTRITLN